MIGDKIASAIPRWPAQPDAPIASKDLMGTDTRDRVMPARIPPQALLPAPPRLLRLAPPREPLGSEAVLRQLNRMTGDTPGAKRLDIGKMPFKILMEIQGDMGRLQRRAARHRWSIASPTYDCSHQSHWGEARDNSAAVPGPDTAVDSNAYVRLMSPNLTLEGGGLEDIARVFEDLKAAGARSGLTAALRIYFPESALGEDAFGRLVSMQRANEDIVFRLSQGGGAGRPIAHKQSYALPLCQDFEDLASPEAYNDCGVANRASIVANRNAEHHGSWRAALQEKNNCLNGSEKGWWEARYFDACWDTRAVSANVALLLGMLKAAAESRGAWKGSCTEGRPLRDSYERPISPHRFNAFLDSVVGDSCIKEQLRTQFLKAGGVIAEPPSDDHPVIIGLLATPHQASTGALRDYAAALSDAGATVRLIPLDATGAEGIEEKVDGILIPGGRPVDPRLYGETPRDDLGRTTPECDATSKGIILRALDLRMPMLGICKGLHMMAVAQGGTLVQDINSEMKRPEYPKIEHRQVGDQTQPTHEVDIEPRVEGRPSVLLQLFSTTRIHVNSTHRQTIKALPPMFSVTGRSPDGVIEAIERNDCPTQWAIQFHPERQRTLSSGWNAVFVKLVSDATRYRMERRRVSAGSF